MKTITHSNTYSVFVCILLFSLISLHINAQNGVVIGNSEATGESAFATGDSSLAQGFASIAAGSKAQAIGDFTLALGDRTTANGKWSQAIGFGSRTDGDYSFGAGFFNYVAPSAAFGVGVGAANVVRGAGGLAIGRDNISEGDAAIVLGTWSKTHTYGEIVLGAYADTAYSPSTTISSVWNPTDRLFSIANGNGDGAGNGRYSNALTMLKNGDAQFNGQVNVRGQYFFPGSDGNHGDVLKTNGQGDLVWLPTDISVDYAGAQNVNMLIPDDDKLEGSIEITGTGIIDSNTKILVCLDVKHVDLTEVEIRLFAPDNDILLAHGAPGSDFSSTCFSTEANQSLTSDIAPFVGVYEPDDNFGILEGGNMNGIWTLEVEDRGGQPVLGFFNNWSLAVYNPNRSATTSSNNPDHGFVAEQNELSGYYAFDNEEHGLLALMNDKSGVVSKENEEYGFEAEKNTLGGYFAFDNDISGFIAKENEDNGYEAEKNKKSGFYAFDNDEHGMLAFKNDKSGVVSKENEDYGYEAEKNKKSGFYAFDNDDNGFLATDNVIGFKATGSGVGFESQKLGIGFKVDQPGALLGFESNAINGFKANSTTTGYESTGAITAFKANSATTGYESTGAITAFRSTGGTIGLHVTSSTAALLNGDVIINGTTTITGFLAKAAGSFKIDHPLDPENKYLYHSFVESPDMMNIYNGNVILDADGTATIEMEDWFEALNMEFRYQLTCIGGFAQVYIADKIKDGKFKIAGGSPGLEVSWQVTGIRQDPYAVKNRIQVEVEKEAEYKGSYLNADAYDQPKTKSAQFVREQLSKEKVAASSAKGQTELVDSSED